MTPTGNLTYLLKNHVLPKKYLKAYTKASNIMKTRKRILNPILWKKSFFYKSLSKIGDTINTMKTFIQPHTIKLPLMPNTYNLVDFK